MLMSLLTTYVHIALLKHVDVLTEILWGDSVPPPISQVTEQAVRGLGRDQMRGSQVKLSHRSTWPSTSALRDDCTVPTTCSHHALRNRSCLLCPARRPTSPYASWPGEVVASSTWAEATSFNCIVFLFQK